MPMTSAQLKQVVPHCSDVEVWTNALNAAMARFDISTPQRMAAFVAQLAHESSEFRRLVESLNYSAARLMEVWPKRFPTLERAQAYAHNEEKLGSFVYANRLGNGNEASRDGWQFRGRGLIQLTGRSNYRSVGAAIDRPLESQPDLLLQPEVSALAAAQFWQSHHLNELADSNAGDDDDEDFETITVRINGGTHGLKARKAYWAAAKSALGIA
jgi:putative chitinase